MFGIGMPELILILAIALIVIGPKKLPDLAKSLGRALGEFKRATNDLKESSNKETGLDEVRDSFKEVDQEIKATWKEADDAPAANRETGPDDEAIPDDPMSKVKQAMDALNQDNPQPPEADAQDSGPSDKDKHGRQENTAP
ncbi:MAG: Sec-independent protein translocase protein TatB [Desulfosarcinaceae bacterium]